MSRDMAAVAQFYKFQRCAATILLTQPEAAVQALLKRPFTHLSRHRLSAYRFEFRLSYGCCLRDASHGRLRLQAFVKRRNPLFARPPDRQCGSKLFACGVVGKAHTWHLGVL